MLSRRELIKLGLYGGSGALLSLTRDKSGALAWALKESSSNDVVLSSPLASVTPFTSKLPIPANKKPTSFSKVQTWKPVPPVLDPATTYYEIHMRPAPAQLFPSGRPSTMIWGFDPVNLGPTYIGPTLVANIGEQVCVRMHNNLGPKITSIIHHHGAHVTSLYDGSALWSQQIKPFGFRDYVYPNDDDIAATHWYHDHDIDNTGHNVFMGLEGCLFLHDQVEADLKLPGNPTDPAPAGELPFDMPLVFQDRAFDANCQLVYNPFQHNGFLGDTFMVNGGIQPSIRVANRKYRLRMLNGSNARFYNLSLFTNTGAPIPFHFVGSDGGLYSQAVQVDGGFQIGPAERVEAIVDFSGLKPGANTHVYLNNCLSQTDGRKPNGLVQNCATVPQSPGADGVGSLCRFDIQFTTPDPSVFTPGQTLRTDVPVYNKNESVRTRTWQFERGKGGEWLVNGLAFDPGPRPPAPENPRIDTNPPVKVGTTEIWQLVNGSGGWFHPVHIHRNQWRIMRRAINGTVTPLAPTQQGLRDVFVLEAGETLSVITKYTGADKVGNYVMHCHNLEHEDMAMMIVWDVAV